MAKLYLVRHGQTEWNVEGRLQGSKDSPLTERGIQQARETGRRLQEYHFDAAYCSPLGRAKMTAETILADRGITITEDVRLREIHLGKLEGMNEDSLPQALRPAFHAFWHSPASYQPVEGEPFSSTRKRMVDALFDLAEKHYGQQVLIVSHGAAIKLALCHLEGKDEGDLWTPPWIENGQVSCLEWSPENGLNITLYNGLAEW